MAGPISHAADRQSARDSARQPTRLRRREPHEKFNVDKSHVPPGMVEEWHPVTILGMPNRDHIIECMRSGWQPARAEQFPELSGYGMEFAAAQIPIGMGADGRQIVMENVKPGDPIVINGQMLFLRPQEYKDEALAQTQRAADRQVQDQIDRLTGESRRQVGKQFTKHARQYVDAPDEPR